MLIPVGYLAYQGQMNFWLIVLASTVGGLVGASFNYVVSMWLGRPFLERWGRYFFVRPTSPRSRLKFSDKKRELSLPFF